MWYFIVGCFLVSACTGENLYADIVDTARTKRENRETQQQETISYRPYNEAPERIRKLVELLQTAEPLVHLPAQPAPQLQAASTPNAHRIPAPVQPIFKQAPLIQSAQYSPKIQYGQAPEQPNYKGIQAVQAGIAPGPVPVHGQPTAATSTYTPQYKTQYNPQQQQLDPASVYKAVYNQQQRLTPNSGYKPPQYNNQINSNQQLHNPVYRPVAAKTGLGQYQSQPQYPKNLPPHIQKIIESQRAFYQG